MKDNLLLKASLKNFYFCCRQAITQREFSDRKAFEVMHKNREFDKKVLEVCDKANDALACDFG